MGVARRLMTAVATSIAVGVAVVAPAVPATAATPTVAPTLVAPQNKATVSGNPILQWSAVTSAVRYRVQVSSSATFSSLLLNVDTYALRATPRTDLPLGPLYWRVAATNGATGVGPYAVGQFVKGPAAAPVLSTPAHNAVLSYPSQPPVLRWSTLSGVKSYRIELDDANDFVGAASFTTANTSFALADPLILGKSYYWRVQGVSPAGVTGAFSTVRAFQMQWPASTGKPILAAPANDPAVEVTDVAFQWQPVVGAKSYQLQVSPNPDFANNITDDRIVKGTQYSPAVTYGNATYYWRVRALDTGATPHQGVWSDAWQFRRAWTAKPALIAPIGGVSVDSQRFSWTGIKHASFYELQIATDVNFSTLSAVCTTFGTSVTPYSVTTTGHSTTYPPANGGSCDFNLAAGSHYYWRVRGGDLAAGSNSSPVYSVFSTTADFFYMPGIPTMTGPADGASTAAPVLTWDALPGYAKYKVRVIRASNGAVTTAETYSTSYTPTASLATGAYSWYVVAVDADGKEGLSPHPSGYRSFTVTTPTRTASLNPTSAVDAPGQLTMPSLRWQPLTGASSYEVYLAPLGGAYTRLSGTAKLPFAAFTATSEVQATGTYTWYVLAYDANRALIGTSEVRAFVIQDVAFASYVAPANCTPANCSTPQVLTPELRWNPVAGAGFYRVWVALDPDFTNIVRGYTTQHTRLTPRENYLDNAAGQSYYWYVQPCKSAVSCGAFGGESLLSHARAFRKKSRPVTLLAPAPTLTTHQVDVVTFRWADYTETTGGITTVKGYRLQVATEPSFNGIVDDVTVDQPTYQAWAKSYPDGVYYWRVQAIGGGDIPLTFSAIWRLQKTSRKPAPSSAGTTTGLPTLAWAALPYASGYTVEVYRGTDPLFPSANRVLAAVTKLPSFTPNTALPAGTYSWRVRKLNPDQHGGAWSTSVPTFTVSRPAPTLTAPAHLATITNNNILFSWRAVAGASSYLFESSPSTSFTTLQEQVNTVMPAWAAVRYYPDRATYYWRVKVLDGKGNVMATSVIRRFAKDAARPTVAGVSPTTGLAVDGRITVTFSEPVKGISTTGLRLRIAGTTSTIAGAVTPAAGTGTTTATFRPLAPLVPGQYYELLVGSGITDLAGNPVTASITKVRTALTVENTSPALTRRWDVDTSAAASGGAYISARAAGATASFRFTGTAVSVLGRTSNASGYADIYIDGVKQNSTPVSFYSATVVDKRTMFAKTGLANTAHTLTIKVLGTKPAGSAGTNVDLDAFVAGVIYQESASMVTTGFARRTNSLASGGSYDLTPQTADGTGAEYQFSFRGTGFTWTATKLPSGGTATVFIDGVNRGSVTFFASSVRYRSTVYTSPTLTNGVHRVRLVATGAVPAGSAGTDVTLDTLVIR